MKISIIGKEELGNASVEAYKALRTNIKFTGTSIKSIMFTSAKRGEGSSQVVINLARAFAEGSQKVLVIDSDLRNSDFALVYRLNTQEPGLTDYLSGQVKEADIICNTDIEGLDVILAGKKVPNAAELLESPKFKALIEDEKNNYDYILIDTPALGEVIDASVISNYSDGSVIVTAVGESRREDVVRVKDQLLKGQAKLLGVVLNKTPVRRPTRSELKKLELEKEIKELSQSDDIKEITMKSE